MSFRVASGVLALLLATVERVQAAPAASASPSPSPSASAPRLPPASAPPAAKQATVPVSPPPGSTTPGPAPLRPAAPDPAPPRPAPPSPVPPTAETTLPAPTEPVGVGAAANEPLAEWVVGTRDATPAESDHEAVVGTWGIEVRPVASTLPVFTRRASTGCPLGTTAPGAVPECAPISVSTLGVRHWFGRNLAFNAGLALALGGGSEGGRLLDSYFAFGPVVGVSVLLGNWRHLSVAASPGLQFVMWKPAGSADTAYVADLRADLEGELHFGFIGVPALSLGIRSGVLLRLEHAADVSLWSAGVSGATSLRGLVSDLLLRYYF